jgi:hypothetical protein
MAGPRREQQAGVIVLTLPFYQRGLMAELPHPRRSGRAQCPAMGVTLDTKAHSWQSGGSKKNGNEARHY